MSNFEKRSFDSPDEHRDFLARGSQDIVRIGGIEVSRRTVEPGFRWSVDVGTADGLELCDVRHVGYCAGGEFAVRMSDGDEARIRAGDVYRVEPGHDGWTVGDETCVLIEFTPID